ncbi:hypothetical protein Mapa_012937 [Marchantia paleacea]|nr:hypothetical protein Mapa_012937 [Marchantia paleacea]
MFLPSSKESRGTNTFLRQIRRHFYPTYGQCHILETPPPGFQDVDLIFEGCRMCSPLPDFGVEVP